MICVRNINDLIMLQSRRLPFHDESYSVCKSHNFPRLSLCIKSKSGMFFFSHRFFIRIKSRKKKCIKKFFFMTIKVLRGIIFVVEQLYRMKISNAYWMYKNRWFYMKIIEARNMLLSHLLLTYSRNDKNARSLNQCKKKTHTHKVLKQERWNYLLDAGRKYSLHAPVLYTKPKEITHLAAAFNSHRTMTF